MYGRSHKDYDYQGEWNDDTNHPWINHVKSDKRQWPEAFRVEDV